MFDAAVVILQWRANRDATNSTCTTCCITSRLCVAYAWCVIYATRCTIEKDVYFFFAWNFFSYRRVESGEYFVRIRCSLIACTLCLCVYSIYSDGNRRCVFAQCPLVYAAYEIFESARRIWSWFSSVRGSHPRWRQRRRLPSLIFLQLRRYNFPVKARIYTLCECYRQQTFAIAINQCAHARNFQTIRFSLIIKSPPLCLIYILWL